MVEWRSAAPRVVLLVVLLVTNVALVGAMSTSNTPYGPYNYAWDGTSDLRASAADAGESTLAVDATAYGDATNGSTAVIVAPQTEYGVADATRVGQFVRRGGTLVLAGEPAPTNALLTQLDARARVNTSLLRDEQSNFRDPALPVATNVSEHPLVEDVESLTLNHATTLDPNNATVLVSTGPTAYLDRNRNGTFDADEQVGSYPVATVESLGEGRVVLLSDASVFTNAIADREGNQALIESLLGARTLLDQSHAGSLPPLPYALVVLRTTPMAQFGVGVAAVALLLATALGVPGRLSRRVGALRGRSESPTVELDDEAVAAYLGERHPEWDDDRVRRVTKAIRRRRGDGSDND